MNKKMVRLGTMLVFVGLLAACGSFAELDYDNDALAKLADENLGETTQSAARLV